jgi:hypothetical protein
MRLSPSPLRDHMRGRRPAVRAGLLAAALLTVMGAVLFAQQRDRDAPTVTPPAPSVTSDPPPERARPPERTSTTPVEPAPMPWLQTSGNRIVSAATGDDVILRGANVGRSEWDMSMDAERRSIPVLASAWKGNVIVRGFASDPVLAGDPTYLGLLDEYVRLAATNRMYVVFAWRSHEVNGEQPTRPDDRAQAALADLARRYHGLPHVVYALQVEPRDTAWEELHPRYEQMVDAIRAAAHPHEPIVMIPGADWSRDVSGALTLPVNRGNVVYKTHPYNSRSLFQEQFVDTYEAGMPVFIGEFGLLPDHDMHMPDVEALMELAGQLGLGWAAWTFDVESDPALLADASSFAPSVPYGEVVKAHMSKTPPVPAGRRRT